MKYIVTFYEIGSFKIEALTEETAKAVAVAKANNYFAQQIKEGYLEPLSEEDVAAVEEE